MKKMLLVLCAVMLVSVIASAQLVSPTTYDRTYSGYCDGARLVLQKLSSSGTGSTKVYVAGFHDLVDVCGFPDNAPLIGHKSGAGPTVPPHNITGLGGPVLDTGDADIDAQCLCFSGIQFNVVYDIPHGFSAIMEAFLGANGDYFCCEQTLVVGLPAKGNTNVGTKTAGGTFARPIGKTRE